jgi:hypothetical protein
VNHAIRMHRRDDGVGGEGVRIAGKCPPHRLHVARKFFTKYIRRKFSYILQGIFVIVYNGRLIINYTYCLQKCFASRECPSQLLITLCATIHSLRSTYAGSSIFDLHSDLCILLSRRQIHKSI